MRLIFYVKDLDYKQEPYYSEYHKEILDQLEKYRDDFVDLELYREAGFIHNKIILTFKDHKIKECSKGWADFNNKYNQVGQHDLDEIEELIEEIKWLKGLRDFLINSVIVCYQRVMH